MPAPVDPTATVPNPNSGVYYEDRTATLYGGTIALQTLATLFVILRFISRKVSKNGFWWDDWMILPAMAGNWGISISSWCQIAYAGYGRHTVPYGGPVTAAELELFLKILMVHQCAYFICSFFFKTSLILLYYRVFGVSNGFRKVLVVAWIIVLCYFVGDVLAAVFECSPVAFYWDQSIPGGHCVNTVAFYRWNGVAGACMDLMILTLTIPMIWRLSLRTSQKLQLTAVFTIGSFVFAASIIRVTTFSQVILPDITYTLVTSSTWSTMEQSIGVICACLPVLPNLFRRVFRMKGSKNASEQKFSGHGSSSAGKGSNQANKLAAAWPKGRWRQHQSPDGTNMKTDYDNDIFNTMKSEDFELGVPTKVTTVDHVSGMRADSAGGLSTTPPLSGTDAVPNSGSEKSHIPKWFGKKDPEYEILERA